MSKILNNVSDFDGVIRTGYLIIDFYSFCCLKQPSLARYSLQPGIGIVRHFTDPTYLERSRVNYFRFFSEVADKVKEEFMDKYFYKKVTNYYKDNIAKDTYIVSFNPKPLIQLAGEYLGINVSRCIGSPTDVNEKTGKLIHPLCYGKNKLQYLLQKIPDLKVIENYYTDTPAVDKDIIAISKNVYYVKGDRMQKQIKKDGIILEKPVVLCKK
jgi:hypothetical protein